MLSSDKSKNLNPDIATVSDVVWSTRFLARYSAAESFFKHFGNESKEAGAGGSRGASAPRTCTEGDWDNEDDGSHGGHVPCPAIEVLVVANSRSTRSGNWVFWALSQSSFVKETLASKFGGLETA